jgi:hypothetical protein
MGFAFGEGRIVMFLTIKAVDPRDGPLLVCLSDSSTPSFGISNSEVLPDESPCILLSEVLVSSRGGVSKNFWTRSKHAVELAVPGIAASRASAELVVKMVMDKAVNACVIFRPSDSLIWV